MKKKIRVIDTGHLSAAENMALDEAMLEAREEDRIPDTIRFLSFNPPAALVGYFQTVEKELREDFCLQEGIDVNRRITGGGALYWSTYDVGWEIFSTKKNFRAGCMEDYYELFCSAVARGINEFGIDSAFRPRNDIEVRGKKISGSGGTSLKDAFIFQGTLLVDLDIDIMLRCLRVPVEKLNYSEISSLKERITWLAREAGYRPPRQKIIENILKGFKEALGVEYYRGGLLPVERDKLAEKIGYFKSPRHLYRVREKESQRYIRSLVKSSKSVVRCAANIDVKRGILKNLYITGDYFLYPRRAVFDLESVLKNIPIGGGQAEKVVKDFFNGYSQKITGISSGQIIRLIEDCFTKAKMGNYGIPEKYFNDIFLVHCDLSANSKIEVLLLPYCAKLPGCRLRYKQGCTMCGECSIEAAQGLAEKYGIRTLTIVSFEHLMETLEKLKDEGVRYYAGCCCEAFYQKHQQDFEATPLPGILINIENTTCYDLGKERDAYKGRFEGFTHIKTDLLKRVLEIMS